MASSLAISGGTSIGPYVVEKKLGEGSSGAVYLARDEKNARTIALKLLHPEPSAATRARIVRDARSLATVDHIGIAHVFAAGEHEGTTAPWIAAEFVRGTDLKRVIAERGSVPPLRALRWVAQMIEALAAAHDAGVVHCDLRPSNILVTHDDQIKLTDFGLARKRGDSDIAETTPSAYVAPEQIEYGLADERSDVWAIGCILFELVVGVPPFLKSGGELAQSIIRDDPFYPPAIPQAVAEIVSACLRKSSFARVASMRELRALVRDAIDSASAERATTSLRPGTSNRPPAFETSRSLMPSSSPRAASARPLPSSRPPPSDLRAMIESIRPSSPSIPKFDTSRSSGALESAGGLRASKGNVKGMVLRPALAWFDEKYGRDAIALALVRGSAELRATVRVDEPAFGLIASGWYGADRAGELFDLLEGTIPPADQTEFPASLGRMIAKDNIEGVYKSFTRLLSTRAMVEQNIQRVWRTYSDEATFVVKALEKGNARFEVRGALHHHPKTCLVLGLTMSAVLRSVGYRELTTKRTQCLDNNDLLCAFEGHYIPDAGTK